MSAQSFGATLTDKGASFRLWAPAAKRVDVILDKPHPMQKLDDGWFGAEIDGVSTGARYRFRIDGDLSVPDPASRFQPDDVAGPSELVDHGAFKWRASDWRGRPWQEAVFLETHVGTFTQEGTYRAMIDKLDHLVETGITALELLPLADFPGNRNWGYDGVLLYAPDSIYGKPDDLKTLIDEAHRRGLMVFLDVVYNHFGPDGNYLGAYAPNFFRDAHTPWGSAIDYRVPQVRAFAIENAVAWLRDYRFDGLRLDAVHAIVEGEETLLRDLSIAVGELAKETERHIHLVLENDDNRAALLNANEDPPKGKYRAQWNDDFHHAWHVLLTGETKGYYSDYADNPRADIARALGSGFIYQGEASPHREGQLRGEPSGELSPTAFVNFLQNHDQIGNRELGDRLESVAKPRAIEAGLAITLLMPTIPMLFMGEEWGSQRPFPFFCDFKGDLAKAVREGRRKEFKAAYAKYGDDVPDPLNPETFQSAKLDWDARDHGAGKQRLELVRKLLAIRRKEIVPLLADAAFGKADVSDAGLMSAKWTLGDRTTLHLAANLSDDDIATFKPPPGRTIWGDDGASSLAPWAVLFRIDPH